MFPCCLDSFQIIWKFSWPSGKFPDILNIFWTIWKVSRQSEHFIDDLESSRQSENFLDNLEICKTSVSAKWKVWTFCVSTSNSGGTHFFIFFYSWPIFSCLHNAVWVPHWHSATLGCHEEFLWNAIMVRKSFAAITLTRSCPAWATSPNRYNCFLFLFPFPVFWFLFFVFCFHKIDTALLCMPNLVK